MATTMQPTRQDGLHGFRWFNQWQAAEAGERLPQLTVFESLKQFFELGDLVCGWRTTPELRVQWLAEEHATWVERINRRTCSGEGWCEIKSMRRRPN